MLFLVVWLAMQPNPPHPPTPLSRGTGEGGGDANSTSPWQVPGLRAVALDAALKAWDCAKKRGDVDSDVVGVIDFGLPSVQKRLWVLDVKARRVVLHELVAHGKNSGGDVTTAFSNVDGSLASSIGVFRAAEEYVGKHGRSLRLDGLEPGFNDRARPRDIVVHGADYVSEAFARAHKRLGRSWGCPAVPLARIDDVIKALKRGKLVVAVGNEPRWWKDSGYLTCTR